MNKRNYIVVLVFLVMVGSNNQTGNSRINEDRPAGTQVLEWVRIQPRDEEFAVYMPDQPIVFPNWITNSGLLTDLIEQDKARAYGTSVDGLVYIVMCFKGYSHDRGKPDKIIEAFIPEATKELSRNLRNAKVRAVPDGDVPAGNFTGKQYLVSTDDVSGVLRCYVTKDRVYLLEAIGGDKTNPSIQRFLASFQLGYEPFDSGDNVFASTSRPVPGEPEPEAVETGEVDRKPLILLRRQCPIPPEARNSHISGIIQIDTVFTASGKVANIKVARGLSHGLSEAAAAAARDTLFLPALKQGKRVSRAIRVEYAFTDL